MKNKIGNKTEERRFLEQPFEIREVEGKKKIIGYAARFNSKSQLLYGMFEEIIAPGAFDGADMSDVRALFNHDSNIVLGRTKSGTLRVSVDEVGLRYEIDAPETAACKDLMISMQRGDVSQSSFAFRVEEDEWNEDTEPYLRTIKRFSIVKDVSPVTFPAYTDTSSGMREIIEGRQLDGISSDTTSKLIELIDKRNEIELELDRLAIEINTL